MTPSAEAEHYDQRISANLAEVRARIERACVNSGRDVSKLTLVGVTKTFPLAAVSAGIGAGLTDFGENRVQELAEKAELVPGKYGGGDVCWHLIGPLQRNKVKSALQYMDLFHALDSVRLAEALNRRCADMDRTLECLVQVNVSREESKSGVVPEEAHAFVDEMAGFEHLTIRGFMTLAAPAETHDARERVVRPQFKLLRQLRDSYRGGASLDLLSMGMSDDLEVAVEEGATHVRIGSALFGERETSATSSAFPSSPV
jgi:PLP dependent protein